MVALLWSKYYLSSISTVVFLMGSSIPIIGKQRLWPGTLPQELLGLDISPRIHTDALSTAAVASDFGMLTNQSPAAVLHPSSDDDIASLVRLSYTSARPFPIAARGHGHSISGQASAPGGVVVVMRSIASAGSRITVVGRPEVNNDTPSSMLTQPYVDAGGEQLWVDVLHETLKHGLSPRSWTDYLHLTVGGTLSNAGISGQAFRHGPQISNVLELDVITGRGEKVTCSEDDEPDLFHAVLGGLGQFGIITRARIALDPAPQRVKWVRLIYTEFADFTGDQEYLISLGSGGGGDGGGEVEKRRRGFDYVEGSLFLEKSPINSWRSSFFSAADIEGINSLAVGGGNHSGGDVDGHRRSLYCLEGSMYYDSATQPDVDMEMELLLKELRYARGFAFANDVSYVEFLDRVHEGEKTLKAKGLWQVPHPWLNIFVPRSGIADVEHGVFNGILRRLPHRALGPTLIFPLNKTKWDERTSAVIPESEEVFYSVGLLRSAGAGDDWQRLEEQNQEILRFLADEGIGVKQYIPSYEARSEWRKHFGRKWDLFLQRKMKYDPKAILSPGQRIFTLQDTH